MTADLLLIAPPESRRVRAFQASLAEQGRPPARVVAPLDVLRGAVDLASLVRPGSVVRLDSTGEEIATEEALIRLGGGVPGDLAGGELAPMRAWYAGFSRYLAEVDAALAQAPPHRRMQRRDHILTMFDKAATHARLHAAGVPVPEALPEVHSAEELIAAATARGWSRVFVKLTYGSSASGAVALQWQGPRVSAMTTVRLVDGRPYNSRRLVRYEGGPEVHALLDALAPHRLHVERWLPKASFQGRTVDLRMVVIGGRAQHTLVRSAAGPITNLHLGNERGDLEALKAAVGPARWAQIGQVAEHALAAFPGALYGGVDVLLTPGFRRVAVLEVNAFGDYHRGVRVNGLDTYGAQLRALEETAEPVQAVARC
ncbi:STM4014 family protein [Deinococcus sp. HMF7604]|uniref:STM4014 family protein n=1 Tax=Deinococcus betulae TaxID=2873312 RepID=UPI001CCCEAA7|nr:STM4014 family protein [Deinococcus betulae]MBZ9750186.1 STM4014 family protein [Deinococcus betulae]